MGFGHLQAGSVFLGRMFPLGIDFGFELAAAYQLLKVPNDSAAGNTKLAGKGRDIGALAGLADDVMDAVLAAEAVRGAAEQVEGVDAMGTFQGFKLPDGLALAAFLEGSLDRALEDADVHRFSEAIVGAAWPLKCLHLLVHFQGTRHNDDGDKRQQFFERGEEIQAELAPGKHVVKDQDVGRAAWDLSKGLGAIGDAAQLVFGEGFLVNLILEIVVFDDEYGGYLHVRFPLNPARAG